MRKIILVLSLWLAFNPACRQSHDSPARYDVVWNHPSHDASGSMPLGNGDVGVNVWADSSGNVVFYIGKSDAFNSNSSLLKVGRIRLSLRPNLFSYQTPFQQHLDLEKGMITITAGDKGRELNLNVRVDAHHPVVLIDAKAQYPFTIEAKIEIWRRRARTYERDEMHVAYGLIGSPDPVKIYPDSLLPAENNRIGWLHRNPKSIWRMTLEKQGMKHWADRGDDPLLGRTFGALLCGDNAVAVSDSVLKTTSAKTQHLALYLHTAQPQTADQWVQSVHQLADSVNAKNRALLLKHHQQWWRQFWQKSWIDVDGDSSAETVSRAYALQRFISACAGRGAYPQKFNGSLCTVDANEPGDTFDADYRRWGGGYWLQNTRLIYWPMLKSGDFELMQPFFRFYMQALPYAKAATKRLYGHDGAFFPETMTIWGSYNICNFGWNTPVNPFRYTQNQYIRYYFQGALEVAAMMLDYYRYTGDALFVQQTLLPFAVQVLRFYEQHYGRDENGRIYIYPSQALETYWDAVNPVPAVAGLRWNVDGILQLPDSLFTDEQRLFFREMQAILPQMPLGEKDGLPVVLPAARIAGEPRNHENPEFYAIFPYRFYGTGKEDFERMRNSFESARVRVAQGWQHYDVNAAFMGYTDLAKDLLVKRAQLKHEQSRFPAFWGPNYDWIPDQDHGNNILICLQAMLLQTDGKKLLLCPAWPKTWNAAFKLHAPCQTVIQGKVENGRVVDLEVTPEERRRDVVIMNGF
jgi:hypothetical protein